MYQALDFTFVIWGVIVLFSAMVLTIVIKEIYEHVMEKRGKSSKIEIRVIRKRETKENERLENVDKNEQE